MILPLSTVCVSIDISLNDLPRCGTPMKSPAGGARLFTNLCREIFYSLNGANPDMV
jgi:hypothetical protein